MIECKSCKEPYSYTQGDNYVCPMCDYTWPIHEEEEKLIVRDCHGNLLENGDSVIVIKDLKVKGSSQVIKQGTKVKPITLVDGDHNIDAKVDKIGAVSLKSEFVKKG